jgi:iron(III) transport system substrate-binding protein
VLGALVLASCGSPSSPGSSRRKTSAEVTRTQAAVQGLPLTQRDARLLTLAKKEGGTLSLYTTLNAAVLGPLVGKFEAKYGLRVAAFSTDAASLVSRLNQETQAGRRAVDVIDTGGPELNELANEGDLADFSSPLQSTLGPGAVQHGWTTTRYTTFVVGWNTSRVRPGQQPTSWEELAQPRWRGRISLAPDTTGVSLYAALSAYWRQTRGWTQAQSDRVFEGIARNARSVPGQSENAQLLASGEIDAAAGSVSTNSVDDLRAKGAPVAWKPAVLPIVLQQQGAALVRDASHPAAALLFLDYELSDGQRVFVADHREPARRDLDLLRGIKSTVVDLNALAAHQAALNKRWAQIIALGTKSG